MAVTVWKVEYHHLAGRDGSPAVHFSPDFRSVSCKHELIDKKIKGETNERNEKVNNYREIP